MPKRKRSSYGDDGDRIFQMRQAEVHSQLAQSKKLLHRALKTAKGFERQKLGKRLKNATTSNSKDEAARITREIEALKVLDLDKMTEAQLYKSLLKIKTIADSDALPEEVRKEIPKPQGSEEEIKALYNVVSGMWNMKPVKEVMEKVISGTYLAMGIPAPAKKAKGAKKERNQPAQGILKDSSSVARAGPGEEESSEGFEDDRLPSINIEGDSDASGSEDELPQMDQNGDHDEDDLDEETLAHYDALLGASSDEESFDELKYNIKRTAQPLRLSLSLSPTPSASLSESISFSEAGSQSPSPPPQKAPKPAKTKTKAIEPPKKAGGSTFLPTLMGGYWSGSESSASDIEDDSLRAAPVRKNRPGQMARRAIWEKKFGGGANHIKSGKGAVADKRNKGTGKDDGWDAKRGAKDGGGRSRGRDGQQRDFRQVTGENAIAVEPRKRGLGRKDDAGKLHPSWEAAKKAKETKKTAKFEGKKVTFD